MLKVNIFDIFSTHLKPFLDKLIRHLYVMFTIILKKIIKYKDKRDLDARLWIQKILLKKSLNT